MSPRRSTRPPRSCKDKTSRQPPPSREAAEQTRGGRRCLGAGATVRGFRPECQQSFVRLAAGALMPVAGAENLAFLPACPENCPRGAAQSISLFFSARGFDFAFALSPRVREVCIRGGRAERIHANLPGSSVTSRAVQPNWAAAQGRVVSVVRSLA